MRNQKVIYYSDELNDEFSEAQITPRVIDKDFRYFHNKLWDICSLVIQNVLSMPIKLLYQKYKFHLKYVGREKLKECRDRGYFIYGNHTQPFADTFIPSVANYPHRNFFIVNPENVSMPGMHVLVEMLGAIPIPCDIGGMKNFVRAVEDKIKRNYSVTIYPEAHIWPYYTGIRNFSASSFGYPCYMNKPVFTMTNCYQKRVIGKYPKVVTYIDGPFYPDTSLPMKERKEKLREECHATMERRAKENSTYSYVVYEKKASPQTKA